MYSTAGRAIIPRTQLVFPAHRERMYESAARSAADQLIIDFEDGCPFEWKGERSHAIALDRLRSGALREKIVSVRINGYHTRYFYGDLSAVVLRAPNAFESIVLPKTERAEEVLEVDALLAKLEAEAGWERSIALECLIETPRALLHIERIASCSRRVVGLIFGIADFAAHLGIGEVVQGQNLSFLYAKQRIVVTAKAFGLHAIDNVFFPIWRADDPEPRRREIELALRKKNEEAARMGMDGTWIIHPQQVEIANACFTPSETMLQAARNLLERYRAAGGGALRGESGDMIDEASAKVALAVLARGERGHAKGDWENWGVRSGDRSRSNAALDTGET